MFLFYVKFLFYQLLCHCSIVVKAVVLRQLYFEELPKGTLAFRHFDNIADNAAILSK